ncbi:hypothetical protein Tco_1450061 [Tanacetum coccineum]
MSTRPFSSEVIHLDYYSPSIGLMSNFLSTLPDDGGMLEKKVIHGTGMDISKITRKGKTVKNGQNTNTGNGNEHKEAKDAIKAKS